MLANAKHFGEQQSREEDGLRRKPLGFAGLSKVVKQGFVEEVALRKNCLRRGSGHLGNSGKGCPGRRKSKCKGPEAHMLEPGR